MFAEIFGPDVLIVLVIVALLFGGAKLPQLARSLGSAKSEFEKGQRGEEDEKGKKAKKDDAGADTKSDVVVVADNVDITVEADAPVAKKSE